MPSKSSRSNSGATSANPNNVMAPMNMVADLARQQLALMTETSCAVLGGSETLSKLQQQAAHQASARHQAAAEMLRAEIEPMDVVTIQSELLREDMQLAAQYWSQLASVAMKSQLDMMSRMAEMLSSGSQGGFGNAMDAWRNMVSAMPDGAASRAEVH